MDTRSHLGALLLPCLHMGKLHMGKRVAKGWMRGFHGKEGLATDAVDFDDLPQVSDHSRCLKRQQSLRIPSGVGVQAGGINFRSPLS